MKRALRVKKKQKEDDESLKSSLANIMRSTKRHERYWNPMVEADKKKDKYLKEKMSKSICFDLDSYDPKEIKIVALDLD